MTMAGTLTLQLSIVLAVGFLLPGSESYSFHFGSCPDVKPVANFDIKKFSGLWYVIEKFDVATPCWTYFFDTKSNGTEMIASRDQIINENNASVNASYSGSIEVPEAALPGNMKIQFSDNIIGKHSLTVFDTDYENYAGIFTCQGVVVGHRRSASIISRSPILPSSFIAKARAKLASYDVSLDRLNRVDQYPCSYLPTVDATLGNFTSQIFFGADFP